MNPLAALIQQQWQWVWGKLVFITAATVFSFAWSYYGEVVKEDGSDRARLVSRAARGGGPRAFYIDLMSALLDRIDGLLGDAGKGKSGLHGWSG